MTVLPQPLPVSSQWAASDYGTGQDTTGPANVGGTCSVELLTVPADELWLLERVVVSCTSSQASACTLYLDYVDPGRAIDFTPAGNGDVADSAPPVQLQSGTTLLAVWTGCSAGAKGTIRGQWVVLRRTGG